MPTTLTLKGVPDDLYERLRQTADIHRRSLNNEAISVLESVLLPRKRTAAEHLAEARRSREALRGQTFTAENVDEFKRHGRP